MMNTGFLDYQYSALIRDDQEKTTEQMVIDICKFRQKFLENKDKKEVIDAMRSLEILYFVNIQNEQNVGVQDVGGLEHIMQEIDDENAEVENSDVQSTDSERAIKKVHKDSKAKRKSLETINLYRAYKMLKKPLQSLSEADKNSLVRMLDVHKIVELHKILLDNDPAFVEWMGQTPGKFTTVERWTKLPSKEKIYFPKFNTTKEVELAMDDLLSCYNTAIIGIMKIQEEKEKIEAVFKCAAKVLFGLSLIHAFPDGNGRISRLTCYYCLSLISPFPTPVYNVCSPSTRDEFGGSLMEARGGSSEGEDSLLKVQTKCRQAKPSKLCAILIEANWCMWKKFLADLNIEV